MTLARLRRRLDTLDSALLKLLAKRAAIVGEVWAWKTANGVPRVDRRRERELKTRLLNEADALGLDRAKVSAIFARIVGHRLDRR